MLRAFSGSFFQRIIKTDFVPTAKYCVVHHPVPARPTRPGPKRKNPEWFPRAKLTIHNDFVTHENKDFVKETIYDKYGEPKTDHGLETYPNPVDPKQLLKVQLNAKQGEFIPKEHRSGVIARKIGIMPLWDTKGQVIMSTVLHVEDNHVISYTPPEHVKHDPGVLYPKKRGMLMVGACSTDPFKFTKEYCDLFKYAGVMPKQHLARFFITPNAKLLPGTELNVTHFRVGDYVDVSGFTIDRGFQGVMKRHGFKGQPATHGQTKTHRRPGCIGTQGMARVWKGKKMPGFMGNRWKTLRGLKVLRMNTEYNVLYVIGRNIPGNIGSIVHIRDTMLSHKRKIIQPPFPTNFDEITDHRDEWIEELHKFGEPSITFEMK